jgi:hypothetical protein
MDETVIGCTYLLPAGVCTQPARWRAELPLVAGMLHVEQVCDAHAEMLRAAAGWTLRPLEPVRD